MAVHTIWDVCEASGGLKAEQRRRGVDGMGHHIDTPTGIVAWGKLDFLRDYLAKRGCKPVVEKPARPEVVECWA